MVKVSLVWTNDSVSRQSCPRAEVTRLHSLLAGADSRPSQALRQALQPHFRVRSVHLEWRGLCSATGAGGRSRQPGGGAGAGAGPHLAGYDNSMPQIRNPVDRLNVTAGELLQFQVGGQAGDKSSFSLILPGYT